jgi:hypothetical protein
MLGQIMEWLYGERASLRAFQREQDQGNGSYGV